MLTNPVTQKEYKSLGGTGFGLHDDANIYAFRTQNPDEVENLVRTKSRSPYMIAAANVYSLVQEVKDTDPNYGSKPVNKLLATFQLLGTAGNLPVMTDDEFLSIYQPLSRIRKAR